MHTQCLWCQQALYYDAQRGWVHAEGGTYWQRCDYCGWEGAVHPAPQRCPRCSCDTLRDDHCVWPITLHAGPSSLE